MTITKSKITPTRTNLYTVVNTKTCLYFKDLCKHLVNFFGRLSRPKLPDWKLFPGWFRFTDTPWDPGTHEMPTKKGTCHLRKPGWSQMSHELPTTKTSILYPSSLNFISPQGIKTAMLNVNSIAVLPRFLLEYSSPARGTSKTWQWGHWAPGSTIN